MKSINKKAPVLCSMKIEINASKKKVWEVLTNINDWAKWQTEISQSRLNGDLLPNSTFDWKTNGTKIHSTIHTVEPYKYFGWTGKAMGIYAIHNWSLTEVNGQTTVLVEESMEGFAAKLLKPFLNKNLDKGMLNWLQRLKQQSEME